MAHFQEQRPRFFEGQYLGADDLSATVAYNRLQQARHALGAHTWGIAMGLQLKETSRPGGRIEVYVMPGYAWDGFGRPVVVLAPYNIPAELFRSYVYDRATDGGAGRLIEVWLRYDELATQQVRPGFAVCETEDQRARVHETFRLEVGPRPSHLDRHDHIAIAGSVVDAQDAVQQLDPHTPPVALFDESIPYQYFPPAGERAHWLIPLGVVRWLPSSNPNQLGTFVSRTPDDLAKSRSLRRYIGVVAESLQAADGILRLRDRTRDYSQVQSNDLVWVEGSLRVEGDVRPFGGKIDFRHADGQDYDVPLTIQRTGDPGPGPRALQVSLGRPSPDPQTNNRFSVGPLKADNTLDEKFVVLSSGNIGIGLLNPVCQLHVAAARSTNVFPPINPLPGARLSAHVAVLENTASADNADVLALKIGSTNPNRSNNFITFFGGDSPVGRIEGNGSGGIDLQSPGGDFAECLPLLRADEVIEAGDIIGVFDGKITRNRRGPPTT